MNPYALQNPFNYQSFIDTSYYQSPAAANSTNPLVSLANGIGELFENGLNVYASTVNRLRALDLIDRDNESAPQSAQTMTSDAQKTNNLILMLILGALSIGLIVWIARKK